MKRIKIEDKLEKLSNITEMFEELEPEDQKFIAGVIQGLSFRKSVEAKGA